MTFSIAGIAYATVTSDDAKATLAIEKARTNENTTAEDERIGKRNTTQDDSLSTGGKEPQTPNVGGRCAVSRPTSRLFQPRNARIESTTQDTVTSPDCGRFNGQLVSNRRLGFTTSFRRALAFAAQRHDAPCGNLDRCRDGAAALLARTAEPGAAAGVH